MTAAADLNAGSRFALDARALDGLRTQAKKDPKAALHAAATQFEAVFVKALMKSMRDALPQGDPLASDTTRMVQGMYDEQLAQKLAGRGIGLAEMMVRQLERQSPEPVAAMRLERAAESGAAPAAAPPAGGALPAAGHVATPTGRSTAQAFVERLAPQAREAAAQTGVPARFILGQAALESGWGAHEIRGADGRGSHNLFGIKAGSHWKGATTDVMTTEYVDGVPRRQVERFRAYGSYAEAFADYARLLKTQPRYAEVLANAQDARSFAFGMQRAGYATDPRYGEKLARVIDVVAQRSAGV